MSTWYALGVSSTTRIDVLHALGGGLCFHCGVLTILLLPRDQSVRPETATRDHLHARALGARHVFGHGQKMDPHERNIVLSCYACNNQWSKIEAGAKRAGGLLRRLYLERGTMPGVSVDRPRE